MSRIGKQPIAVPSGVSVEITGSRISVRGPRGVLSRTIAPEISVSAREGMLEVALTASRSRRSAALWGLSRSLVANMVEGVVSGFEKKLEYEGVGYRAVMEGATLVLQVGFSHPVRYDSPPGAAIRVERNAIYVSGADKELVGTVAARIRSVKKPEPYKGKGIRYAGETIRRKAGKKGAAA